MGGGAGATGNSLPWGQGIKTFDGGSWIQLVLLLYVIYIYIHC